MLKTIKTRRYDAGFSLVTAGVLMAGAVLCLAAGLYGQAMMAALGSWGFIRLAILQWPPASASPAPAIIFTEKDLTLAGEEEFDRHRKVGFYSFDPLVIRKMADAEFGIFIANDGTSHVLKAFGRIKT